MKRFLWLLPCWLAPLSLRAAWVAVADHLGLALGGYEFFVGWLTKYPNFGPYNRDVLLGMICVVGLALLPPVFGVLALCIYSTPLWVLRTLAVSQAILYVPVLVRLDLGLLVVGVLPPADHEALIGPFLRIASLIVMIVVSVRYSRWRTVPAAELPA